MKCPRCEAQSEEGARFCEDCGAPLELACPSCGQPVGVGKKFCRCCGAPLTASATPTSTAFRFASPETYTPGHLAEKILTSKSALEGERKQVTVLFADLKGSMELLADRDPEEARKLLDPVLERMMEAVHRYEGTVNQVMGDGIMALFGAPVAHEDHGIRACYAALRMQESVKRYAEDVRRSHGIEPQIRVGLNSGEVVVRSIGSDLRMDYTAVGQTTHLAARMEQLATPGTIRLTSETLRLAEGYVEITPLGPVNVKGLGGPVEVYEVTGAGSARTRLQAATRRGLSRFVGRDSEMEQLRRALQQAADDHGQMVAVVGEPGVGKSRLVYEFTHSYRTREWLILESGSVSYGKATPYLPVIDLLKAYFKIQDRDDRRHVREKVIGKLLALNRVFEATLPAFLGLLDVPVEDRQWEDLDPSQRRQRMLDAVKRLLLYESRGQPLLLVFEDLHWIDPETQALLESLVDGLPSSRILLLVNYRPEYQHSWGSRTYYTQLRIDPLPRESADELLNALLGMDGGLSPLKRLLIERTEGNPFFLEESVRTLVETEVLVGERGAHRLARPLEGIQVPVTVQAVLAARIDRLPPDEKRLLQSAAVVGHEVSFLLLEAIAEEDQEQLYRALTHLQAAELLYETRLFPDLEYTFKHALTHEVAYGSLLQERRRRLHARIVEALEALYAGRLAEHLEQLAHHAVRGELWEKAVGYLRQAGRKAFDRWANREAVQRFEQALGALKCLPESRAATELAIDLRFDLRNSLNVLTEFGRQLEYLREAESLAAALGDQRRRGAALGYLAQALSMTGEHDRAIEAGRRALDIADATGDVGIKVVANNYLGWAYYRIGDYPQAMEFHGRNMTALEGDLTRERFGLVGLPVVYAKTLFAWSLAELGRFTEAITHANDGVRIAGTADHPYSQIFAIWGVGYLNLRRGNFNEAIGPLERGLQLCAAAHGSQYWAWVAVLLGAAYTQLGRFSEGLSLLEQAVEVNVATGALGHKAHCVELLGEGYLLAGRTDEALERANQALDVSETNRERGCEAWALRLLGEIYAHRGGTEVTRAEECYRDGLARAGELGMRPLVAHCHLGLGQLYHHMENRTGAEEHLSAALGLFDQMTMEFWQRQAEAELRLARRLA